MTHLNRREVVMELCIYSVNEENIFLHCKEPDSILHTFVECHYTQAFYVNVVDWFNAKFKCDFSPPPLEILFGTDLNTPRNNELKLNKSLLFAKYYLFYQKMYYKVCNITEFVLKFEQKLLIESRLKRRTSYVKMLLPFNTPSKYFIFFVIMSYFSLPPNATSWQPCENYDIKQETVHRYLQNVDHCCT